LSGTANILQNTYLIAINVTNRQKERYYNEYVPDLMNVRLFTEQNQYSTVISLTDLDPLEYASTFRITCISLEQHMEHRIVTRDTSIDQID
jgi:hypothetical protein